MGFFVCLVAVVFHLERTCKFSFQKDFGKIESEKIGRKEFVLLVMWK